MMAPVVVMDWAKEHEQCFAPPICNKLMHKGQISVMFVGGPNSRKDFHVEEGGELFLQLRGAMELPTVQQGARKVVRIPQGHLFVLPRRIPHSPQRPEAGSLGLVIERCREVGELDCLRWYTDFERCDEVLYERYFRCCCCCCCCFCLLRCSWLLSAEKNELSAGARIWGATSFRS